jgi:hypothetical protein
VNLRSPRAVRLTLSLGILALAASSVGSGSPAAAQGPADVQGELPRLAPADLRAGLAALPAPLAVPAVAADAAGQSYAPQQQPVDRLLEDFERGGWPGGAPAAPILTWLPTTLTDLWAAPGAGYFWATSVCQAGSGVRSLCPICGGPQGGGHACGARYPELTAASVVLRLDLGAQQGLSELQLRLDIWADAEPHEGLVVNYLERQPGVPAPTRRPLRSFTGDLKAWARDQRVDLLNARDEEDPRWRADLSGKVVDLELLFISHSNQPGVQNGQGIFVDNLRLWSRPRTVVVTAQPSATPRVTATATPTPLPTLPPTGDRNVFCPSGEPCGRLRVETYVDSRCDGRFQSGVDSWLAGQRIDVNTGGELLRATTSRLGGAYFLLPTRRTTSVSFTPPAGYQLCANSPAPLSLSTADFGRWGNKQVAFRVKRAR